MRHDGSSLTAAVSSNVLSSEASVMFFEPQNVHIFY